MPAIINYLRQVRPHTLAVLRNQVQDARTKLYKLHEGQGFELEAASAEPHFYDVNEDSSGVPPRWYLEASPCISLALPHVLLRWLRALLGKALPAGAAHGPEEP